MNNQQVYFGIPEELKSIIFWVNDKFRINDLSLVNGGTDIVVEYRNGKVIGYNKVKYPSKYIEKIFVDKFEDLVPTIEVLKQNVIRIFVRRNDTLNSSIEKFTEIWNSKSSVEMPYEVLDCYQLKIYKKYLELFLSDLQFAKIYISVNYPFPYDFILSNWTVLVHGSGHYSTQIQDIDWVYNSKFGLSYNNRIRWNSKLRAIYEYGFINEYLGIVDGLGCNPVEFEERDFQDGIIPLTYNKELSILKQIKFFTCEQLEDFLKFDEKFDEERLFNNEPQLGFEQIKKMWKNDRIKFLFNESVWDNTISYVLDLSFCEIILNKME